MRPFWRLLLSIHVLSLASTPWQVRVAHGQPMGLELERTIGSEAGPLSFGMIGVGAVNERGLLAVSDLSSCEIVLIPLLETAGSARRLGRCGSGPGEFRSVHALAFRGDTILAYDDPQRALIRITVEGVELERVSLAGIPDFRHGLTFVSFLSADTYLLGRTVVPGLFADAVEAADVHTHMVTLARETREILTRFLAVPPIGRQNTSPVLNSVIACRGPGVAGDHLVNIEMWGFEGSIHYLNGVRRATFQTPLGWNRPVRHPAGGQVPGAISTSVVCGRHGFLAWQLRATRGSRLRGDGGRMEIRSYAGQLLKGWDFGPADTLFHERPLAAHEDLVVFRSNKGGSFPRLLVFRLQDS